MRNNPVTKLLYGLLWYGSTEIIAKVHIEKKVKPSSWNKAAETKTQIWDGSFSILVCNHKAFLLYFPSVVYGEWPCSIRVWSFFFFFLIYLFNLFLAVLGLRFCARAFSSCGKWGPLFIAVRGPLTIAASLVVEHRLQTRRLSSCGSRA